jgi:hypothetical protein
MRWLFLISLIATLFMVAPARAEGKFSQLQIYARQKAAFDMGRMDLVQISKAISEHRSSDLEGTWFLGEIRPNQNSGRIEREILEPDNKSDGGKERKAVFQVFDGVVHLLAPLGDYEIPEKLDWSYKIIPTRRIYSEDQLTPLGWRDFTHQDHPPLCLLFQARHLVIFRLTISSDAPLSRVNNSPSVYLIPGGWEKYVIPAFKFVSKNLNLFAGDEEESKNALLKLFQHQNPFVRIAVCRSFRELWSLGRRPSIQTMLGKSTGLERAARTVVLFESCFHSNLTFEKVDGPYDSMMSEAKIYLHGDHFPLLKKAWAKGKGEADKLFAAMLLEDLREELTWYFRHMRKVEDAEAVALGIKVSAELWDARRANPFQEENQKLLEIMVPIAQKWGSTSDSEQWLWCSLTGPQLIRSPYLVEVEF